jgi:hypothetical protein
MTSIGLDRSAWAGFCNYRNGVATRGRIFEAKKEHVKLFNTRLLRRGRQKVFEGCID